MYLSPFRPRSVAESIQRVQCRAARSPDDSRARRRVLLSLVPVLFAAPAQALAVEPEPFLRSSGLRGFLAEEEEAIFELRKEAEGAARNELERERARVEAEARMGQRGLCDIFSLLLCVKCAWTQRPFPYVPQCARVQDAPCRVTCYATASQGLATFSGTSKR
jgi:hypothetical protein